MWTNKNWICIHKEIKYIDVKIIWKSGFEIHSYIHHFDSTCDSSNKNATFEIKQWKHSTLRGKFLLPVPQAIHNILAVKRVHWGRLESAQTVPLQSETTKEPQTPNYYNDLVNWIIYLIPVYTGFVKYKPKLAEKTLFSCTLQSRCQQY